MKKFDPSSSDYLIRPTQDACLWNREKTYLKSNEVHVPLALIPAGIDGFKYVNRPWRSSTDIIPQLPTKFLSERILPGTRFKYPYLSTEDFLEEKIIEINSPIRDFYTTSSVRSSYLLPLKKEFFKFFRIEDIDKIVDLKVDSDSDNVTVTIDVPLVNNGIVRFSKVYREGDKVKCSNSYFFNIAVFPSYRLVNGSNRYDIMIGTEDQSIKVNIYKIDERLSKDEPMGNLKVYPGEKYGDCSILHTLVDDSFDFIERAQLLYQPFY